MLEFKERESADEDSDLEAVIKAGEQEANAAKRKRIKTREPRDDDSSSDDADERYATAKKPKKSAGYANDVHSQVINDLNLL